MTTTYYVVPAGRAFDTTCPSFPGINMARQFAAKSEAEDGIDRGVFAVEMVAGSRKTAWGHMIRHRGGREITTYRDPSGEWVAYDDRYGPEDTMRYGHGRAEEAAVADCIDVVADYEAAQAEAA